MPPGMLIYTSNRLEDLLTVLAERLAEDPLPPLQTETILVPGQGVARWLRFGLAERHGIAAGIALPFPGAFLQQLCRAAAGEGRDRFEPDVLTWRIHRLLADPARQRELSLAARYCADDPDGKKRFQLSQRLAAAFDDYQLYRDDLLARAAAGDDLADRGPHGPWQARLWRALLRDVGLDDAPREEPPAGGLPFADLATVEADARATWRAHRVQGLERLLADPPRAREVLPPRLSVFGAATLPPALLRLLRGVAALVPVTLYVPSPSPHYFGDQARRPTGPGDGNPLLARLGTESREFQDLLVALEDEGDDVAIARHDLGELSEAEPQSLLAALHQDLAWVRERGGAAGPERFAIATADDSVRVHDCHSEHRELEVVRDQILSAFARDPTLEPHEVLVLVPDIERYAPYVHAVFRPVQQHLPFLVADKSAVAELPVCAALVRTLHLAQGRLHVYDVLHLLETPAIQRRFGLFAGDLPVLRHLCDRAGIRWGIDGASRQRRFQVPVFEDNSWRLGIERMLLGVATGPVEDLVLGRLPAADVTSSREGLLERFLGFLDFLFGWLPPLQRPHALAEWADLLDGLAAGLFAPAPEDAAGAEALRVATVRLRATAADARHVEPVTPPVLRDWLQAALGRSADGRGFLGGRVTVAALLPMRAVPVRSLFLCGLDDRSFPRRDSPAPFDLAQQPRRPGDRSPRLDDRQMFLDCLLAARERLHITYIGHSVRDDSECAPSVVVAELLETIDRTSLPPAGCARARDHVTVRHPLQAWSPRYRRGDDPRLFTYTRDPDPEQPLASVDEPPWFTTPLARPAELAAHEVALDELLRFWWHPCRFFLLQTLGVRLPRDGDDDATTESFALSHLDRWKLVDGLVRRALGGRPPPRDPLALARASGLLPVGGTGAAAFAAIDEESRQFLGELGSFGHLAPRPVTASGDGFTIRGELPDVGADAVVCARPSKVKPKDRLKAWVLHVVAAVARLAGDDLPERTVLLAKNASLAYRALEPDVAAACLADLVAGFRSGLEQPLPFFERSSDAYGEALHKKPHDADGAMKKARTAWLPDQSGFAGSDSEDGAVALCMRGRDALQLPEFAAWARRIWRTVYGYAEELG